MESNDALNKEIEDPETFWGDILILTNKFEPFDTFNMEQAMFELKKETASSNHETLQQKLKDLDLDKA